MINLNKKIFTTTNPYNLIDGLWELLKLEINNFEKTLVFLPSHRAIRFCQAMLAEKIGSAVITPMFVAIGTGEEDNDDFDIIDSQKELFIVIKLLQKKFPSYSIDLILPMAQSLIKMLNTMTIEGLDYPDWSNLIKDVNLAKHFEDKAKFFELITKTLPAVLEQDFHTITKAQSNINTTKAWKNKLDNFDRIIVCGSTASAPITSELIQAVYHHKNGKILLPGNVSLISEKEMNLILETESEQHPYFGICNLLKHLNLKPIDVELINTGTTHINKFLTDALYLYGSDSAENLENINISNIECDDEAILSKTICLICQEALNNKQTISIVSPDIGLTTRLKTDFYNYNISADFSTGTSGLDTTMGKFYLSIANLIKNPNNPLNILSVLNHKWTYLGETADIHKKNLSILENDIFRGIYPIKNLSELPDFIKRKELEKNKTYSKNFNNWILKISSLFNNSVNNSYFQSICNIMNVLVSDSNGNKNAEIFNEESKQILLALKSTQDNIDSLLKTISVEDYITIIEQTLSVISVRQTLNTDVFVMGTPEARMIHTDVVILAGLNEGVWPKIGFDHPWINHKMADKFGWPKSIRKVGLMALDFLTLSSAPTVFWIRSKKLGSSNAMESRFLSRVKIHAHKNNFEFNNGAKYLTKAKTLTIPCFNNLRNKFSGISANPPIDSRPKDLYVTAIQTLFDNPYEFYAKYILKLYPMDDINREILFYDFGNIIHDVLRTIDISSITCDELVQKFKDEALKFVSDDSFLFAFWNKRFKDIANLTMALYTEHKDDISFTEYNGSIKDVNSKVNICARADKIWQNNSTTFVMDIKTGKAPSANDIRNFKKAQLGIEAVIANIGGFPKLKKTSSIVLLVMQCRANHVGIQTIKEENVAEIITEIQKTLDDLLFYYFIEGKPFNYIQPENSFGKTEKYAHLSRVKEFL